MVTNTNNSVSGTKTSTATSSVARITVTGGGGGGSNSFVGTWTGSGITLTVKEALEWEVDGLAKAKGTYTYTGNTATLTPTHHWTGTWTVIPPEEQVNPSFATVSGDGNTMTGTYEGNPFTLTKNGGGGGGNSNAATPTISSPLQGAIYTVGEMAAPLFVIANVTDGGTLTYRWYSSATLSASGGTLIPGETQLIYMPSTATAGTFYYYVVVTNTNNSVSGTKTATATSNVVAITVINGGGGVGANTLFIVDIPTSVFNPATDEGLAGIFLTTTSEEDILLLQDKAAVAGADFANGDAKIVDSLCTLSLPLYEVNSFTPWTGSGTYNVYIVLSKSGGAARYFKAGSVTFSGSGSIVTIQFSSATELFLE
jgi:hypothetical protein